MSLGQKVAQCEISSEVTLTQEVPSMISLNTKIRHSYVEQPYIQK